MTGARMPGGSGQGEAKKRTASIPKPRADADAHDPAPPQKPKTTPSPRRSHAAQSPRTHASATQNFGSTSRELNEDLSPRRSRTLQKMDPSTLRTQDIANDQIRHELRHGRPDDEERERGSTLSKSQLYEGKRRLKQQRLLNLQRRAKDHDGPESLSGYVRGRDISTVHDQALAGKAKADLAASCAAALEEQRLRNEELRRRHDSLHIALVAKEQAHAHGHSGLPRSAPTSCDPWRGGWQALIELQRQLGMEKLCAPKCSPRRSTESSLADHDLGSSSKSPCLIWNSRGSKVLATRSESESQIAGGDAALDSISARALEMQAKVPTPQPCALGHGIHRVRSLCAVASRGAVLAHARLHGTKVA